MPILANILLEASDGKLKVSATNLSISITCWINAKVSKDGATTIPAKLLSEFVSRMPRDNEIDLKLIKKTESLEFICGGSTAKMKGMPADEFPIESNIEDKEVNTIQLHPETLSEGLSLTMFAASNDESRAALTNIKFCKVGKEFLLAATDGYRLSTYNFEVDDDGDIDVLVPSSSLIPVTKACEGEGDAVSISASNRQIRFVFEYEDGINSILKTEIVSQLTDANYPDYTAIIPETHSTRAIVNTAELLKAARVASLFARDNANNVKVAFDVSEPKHTVVIEATSAERGNSRTEVSAKVIEGDSIAISFDCRYLIDALDKIQSPFVIIEALSPSRPAAIRQDGDDSFLHVLMPMHRAE